MWIGDSETFDATASSLDPARSYTLKLSTGANSILKFNSCAMGDDSYLSQITAKSIALKLQNILVFACAVGTDTLTAELIENGKSIASETRSLEVLAGHFSVTAPAGLHVNGNSRGHKTGRAVVKWEQVRESHAYQIRYGEECFGKDLPSIVCNQMADTWSVPIEINSLLSQKIIENLAKDVLYRIQIRSVYDHDITSSWSLPIFFQTTSAAWPSKPTATIPFYGYWEKHIYSYTICKNTFPASTRDAWISDIVNGINSWREKVKWETPSGNMIETVHDDQNKCRLNFSWGLGGINEVRYVDAGTIDRECAGYLSPNTRACAPSLLTLLPRIPLLRTLLPDIRAIKRVVILSATITIGIQVLNMAMRTVLEPINSHCMNRATRCGLLRSTAL